MTDRSSPFSLSHHFERVDGHLHPVAIPPSRLARSGRPPLPIARGSSREAATRAMVGAPTSHMNLPTLNDLIENPRPANYVGVKVRNDDVAHQDRARLLTAKE